MKELVKKIIVEVLEHEIPEWNKTYEFDDLESAFAYCRELDFHGHDFELSVFNEQEK